MCSEEEDLYWVEQSRRGPRGILVLALSCLTFLQFSGLRSFVASLSCRLNLARTGVVDSGIYPEHII